MSTRNKEMKRFRIEGTNLATDESGMKIIQEMRSKFVDKITLEERHILSNEIRQTLTKFKEEGRLFWKDGTLIR